MKNFNKILILMVVISVITSVFVYSASADDSDTVTDLTGTTWFIPRGWSAPSGYGQFSVSFNRGNTSYSSMKIGYSKPTMGTEYATNNYMRFGNDEFYNGSPIDLTLVFNGGTDVTNPLLISWLLENGEQLIFECDGSSCPATDVNQDNVCDDCGLPFSVPRVYPLPDPYTVWTDRDTYPYAMTLQGSTDKYLYLFASKPSIMTNETIATSEGSYKFYVLSEGQWVHRGEGSNGVSLGHYTEVISSSVELSVNGSAVIPYDDDFFPIPLWEKVEMITQGEIPLFNQTVGGNLMTVTLCGVGCLTLLMALVLLSKTLRTYLPR